MVDAVLACCPELKSLDELGLSLPSKGYCLMTLHRPVNVDDEKTLLTILKAIVECTRDLPLVFPVHPRTKQKLEQPSIVGFLDSLPDGKLHQVKPFGYVSMLSALSHAKCVLSDSGGIQSESTTLNVPCLSLRERTEQPITLSSGTVTLVGSDVDRIRECMDQIFAGTYKQRVDIPLWDGHASVRISEILSDAWN
jgi:UDP-N-acetylglucosamine 2-epimerase (non-hydrolysing)